MPARARRTVPLLLAAGIAWTGAAGPARAQATPEAPGVPHQATHHPAVPAATARDGSHAAPPAASRAGTPSFLGSRTASPSRTAEPPSPTHTAGSASPTRIAPPSSPTRVAAPSATGPRHHPAARAGAAGHHPGAPVPARPARRAAAAPVPAVAAPAVAPPAPKPAVPETGTNSNLPIPRFASLRSDDVNMRAGPGTRYPIEWVYKRRDLPVEITREFDIWRLVRDADGVQGWVNQATLGARRTVVVVGAEHELRAGAGADTAAVARLQPGVIVRVRGCAAGSDWCDVQVGEYRGFMQRNDVWGLLPNETIQ